MNESALALFLQGFKRAIWLSVALPVGLVVAVVTAVLRTFVTLCVDEGPFVTPTKKPHS